MRKRAIGMFGALVVAGAILGCGRTEDPPAARGPIPSQPAPFADAIPLDYGNLVGVTVNPQSPSWSALWFEAPDRGVTVVWVNTDQGRLHDQVVTIPRR